MKPRVKGLRPGDLDQEQRAIYDDILGNRTSVASTVALTYENGSLVGPFDLLLRSPAVGDAVQRLGTALRSHSSLSATVTETAILAVAVHTGSEFEWYAHSAVARAKGCLTDGDLDRIHKGQRPADDESAGSAWDAARRLLTDARLADSDYAAALAVFGERGLVDLSALVGYYQLLALLLGTFGIGVPESD